MPGKPISETMRPDLGTLWRHRARVVGTLYGFVTLVGTLYYALLLGDFGLNPFHYWEASDFLLATFREPLSIVFGLIAVVFYITMIRGREFNDVLFGSIPWVRRLTLYDRWRDSAWMAPRFGDGALREAQLLTTTNRFVFLVVPGKAPRDPVLHAVPLESLLEIQHCGARRGPVHAFVRGAEQCAPAVQSAPTTGKGPQSASPATVAPPRR